MPRLRQSPRKCLASKASVQGRVLHAYRDFSYPFSVNDTLSPSERSQRMSLVRGKSTRPELAVRKLVHGMGYRYRLHAPELPGKPDLVFRPRKCAIFVHGCFWHRHPDPGCKLARLPKSRQDFWLPKLTRNRERDLEQVATLEKMGWRVLTIWECQLKEVSELKENIHRFLKGGTDAID